MPTRRKPLRAQNNSIFAVKLKFVLSLLRHIMIINSCDATLHCYEADVDVMSWGYEINKSLGF